MRSTQIYRNLEQHASDDRSVRNLLSTLDGIIDESREIHKTVLRNMPEYTLHDEVHLSRVVGIMDRLLPETTLQNLSPLELAGLILCAGLHDIGMAPSAEQVRLIVSKPSEETDVSPERRSYTSFRERFPVILRRQRELRDEGRHHEAQETEAYILSEYLRKTHGSRGRRIILDRWSEELIYEDFRFAARLADTCYSHTQDPLFIESLPCWELVRAPGEYVNWRFIAVLLRLADILDFDAKRTPPVLFEHLGIRSAISLREWEKHRSIRAWDIKPGRIAFSARCPDPVIEKTVRDFGVLIRNEISFARGVLGTMHHHARPDIRDTYELGLPAEPDFQDVGPELDQDGPLYEYMDLGFHLDEEGVISLVMGMNLYGNQLLFLRELLQNAMDSCNHRTALHEATSGAPTYTPETVVELYRENRRWFLAVEDSGMGMDREIIRHHFARIGRSYYRSQRFLQESAEAGIRFQPVAAFGIGVLSVFMVTDHLKVQTRRVRGVYDLEPPIEIDIHGHTGLFWFHRAGRERPGTRLVLTFDEFPSFFDVVADGAKNSQDDSEDQKLASIAAAIKQLAPHPSFSITVRLGKKELAVESKWELPELGHADSNFELYRQVEIDLSSDGPAGLDGIARVLLLQDYYGELSSEVELREDSFFSEALDRQLHDRLEQGFGYIEHIHVDYSEKEGEETESFSTEFHSHGRWSQQGFLIPQPLFHEKSTFWTSADPATSIRYPFVVYYDLDLSGSFAMTLTADRLRIVPDQRFSEVSNQIYEVLSTLLLIKLGEKKVRQSVAFLEDVLSQAMGEYGQHIFNARLQSILGR